MSSGVKDALPFEAELRKLIPTDEKLYNLFEERLPTTGHLALAAALALMSKHVANQDRGFSPFFIAAAGEGKNATLKQFIPLENVLHIGNMTPSLFFREFCGRYCIELGSGFTPSGVTVKEEDQDGDGKPEIQVVDTSGAPDFINNHTLLIPDAEGLTNMSPYNFSRFLDVLKPLIEEGYSGKLGDNYNGYYQIGSVENPVALNLISGCPENVFKRFFISNTFITRILPMYYQTTFSERADTKRRIEHGLLSREPFFAKEVERVLHSGYWPYSALAPFAKGEVAMPYDVQEQVSTLTERLTRLTLDSTGRESVGKREAKIALRMVASHALLNGRREASIVDAAICLNLVHSMSITKTFHLDDKGNKIPHTVRTGSRGHFLTLMCELTGVDPEEHLSKFLDIHGERVYSKQEVLKLGNELGVAT